MDTLKELRWAKDRDLMTARAKELGASVTSLVADGDDKTQISQIENLIAQKVDVLIVVAHNAQALSGSPEVHDGSKPRRSSGPATSAGGLTQHF